MQKLFTINFNEFFLKILIILYNFIFLNNNSILCLFSSNKFNCFFLFLDPLKTHNRRLPIEAIERHYKSLLPPIQSEQEELSKLSPNTAQENQKMYGTKLAFCETSRYWVELGTEHLIFNATTVMRQWISTYSHVSTD